jgi:hypothetical protein
VLDIIGLPPEELDEGVLPPEDLDEVLFEGMMVCGAVGLIECDCIVGWLWCWFDNVLVMLVASCSAVVGRQMMDGKWEREQKVNLLRHRRGLYTSQEGRETRETTKRSVAMRPRYSYPLCDKVCHDDQREQVDASKPRPRPWPFTTAPW